MLATGCGGDDGAAPTSGSQATSTEPPTPTTSVGTPTAPPPAESDAPTAPPATADAPPRPTIDWTTCGTGLDCGRLAVPIDHDRPDAGTIELSLVRHRASDPDRRIGSLLVNPGGPGFGGSVLAAQAEFVYGPELLGAFDIIGWDPRGTGASSPAVDCVDEIDPYFGLDSSPDDEAERRAIEDAADRFTAGCVRRSGEVLPFVSTTASARDIDLIRRALGEDTISYFGFSYGSELGAAWVTLFPDTVRAAVLDGAADPTVGYLEQNLQQAAGFEAAFDTFLADCARRLGYDI